MVNELITKSDMLNFLACPFAFKKAKEDGLDFQDLFASPFSLELAKVGMEHEERVIGSFDWKKSHFDITKVQHVMQKGTIVGGLHITNDNLGIAGEPDLVWTANGELVPIEIKAHKEENNTDPIEIAFYWLLLEPYRKRGKTPKGYYILRQEIPDTGNILDSLTESSVDETHIDSVMETLREMRAKMDYHPIRMASCRDCALFKTYCLDFLKKTKCVSLLTTGGSVIQQLKESKLNIEKISKMSPSELQKFKGIGDKNSIKFYHKALAFMENKPIFFGREKLPDSSSVIFIDTEFYQNGSPFKEYVSGTDNLFALSVCISKGSTSETKVFYSKADDDVFMENDVSEDLKKIMFKIPNALIVTWGGASADVPILKKRFEDLLDIKNPSAYGKKMQTLQRKIVSDFENRHIDLMVFVKNNISFPTTSDSIKTIAEYLGYMRKETAMWGTDTFRIDADVYEINNQLSELLKYLVRNNKTKKGEKEANMKIAEIRAKKKILLDRLYGYCKDDVDSLKFIFDWIKSNQNQKTSSGTRSSFVK